MKTLKQFFFLSATILSLTSCFSYEEVKIEEIKSVKLVELSEKRLVVEAAIQIVNPNNYKIRVIDSEFDLFIKDKRIAKSVIDSKLEILSNSDDFHTVVMKSNYEDLADGALANMLALTVGRRNIDFKVEGHIIGKVFFITRKVDISHSGKVPLKLF